MIKKTNREVELEKYKDNLLNFRDQNLDYTISNKDAGHAAIASNVIFTGTKDKINIYSGNFNSDVADNDDFIEGLAYLISRNIKINLIMDNYDVDNISKGLKILLLFMDSNNISIKKLNDGILLLLKKNKLDNHFMLSDDKMLRKEVCSKNYEANINFNISNKHIFNEIFEFLDENSKSISSPLASKK